MYKAIVYFEDIQDSRYKYHVGDTFPREGVTVSDKRLDELSTNKNRRGKPLIELVEEKVVKPKRKRAKNEHNDAV
jgi:hypothetical protein